MTAESITSRFTALYCARNTADQNKRLVVPHILRSRAPRTKGKIGNTKTWLSDDVVFRNVEAYAEGQWAANLFKSTGSPRPGKYIWDNCFVSTNPEPFNAGMKWGLRGYAVPECSFTDSDFFGIPKEHGLYLSNQAGTTVDRCTFIRMGSQGVQMAHRPLPYNQYQGDNRPYEAKPRHTLRGSHFIDCGQGGSRPSFTASYFNPGSEQFPGTLEIDSCSFVADWTEPRYDGYLSSGALVVSPMQGNNALSSNMMERVTIKNTLFDYTNGDRPMAIIRSTDTVVIEDCCFIARKHKRPNVDIDAINGWMGESKTKRIVLRNNVAIGGCKLRVFKREEDGGGYETVDLNTRGVEIVIDGETGTVISERKMGPTDPVAQKRLADRIAAARRKYFGS